MAMETKPAHRAGRQGYTLIEILMSMLVVGIMIAGIASLAPTRRTEVAQLAMKAFLAGTLVSLSTACVAGVIL